MTEVSPARRWRENLHLTIRELSELTGYSKEAIYLMERGRNSVNQSHDPRALRRYRCACLAVTVLKLYKIASIDQWPWGGAARTK